MPIILDGTDSVGDLGDALAAKANLASPTFTGTPAAPTAANGTNTTQIATTAFVTTAVANGGGMVPIVPTSLANSGGSATVSGNGVSFSGCTSLSLNGVFSSTYSVYVLQFYGTASSAGAALNLRWRVSGTDSSTADYFYSRLQVNGTQLIGSRSASQTNHYVGYVASTGRWAASAVAYNPGEALSTTIQTTGMANSSSTNLEFLHSWGQHALATAYDGLTIYPDAGNISGFVRVYGLRN